jgi:hypothetical protein
MSKQEPGCYTNEQLEMWYEMNDLDCESLDLICETEQDIYSVLVAASHNRENREFFRKYDAEDPDLHQLIKEIREYGI